jgi:hypothetical protein
MTWPEPPPRLRAGLALPLVSLVFGLALLGTPERNRDQVAYAQTVLSPLGSSRIEVAAQPPHVEELDASKQTAPIANAKNVRCATCHQGQLLCEAKSSPPIRDAIVWKAGNSIDWARSRRRIWANGHGLIMGFMFH